MWERIEAGRVVLEPVTVAAARAVLDGAFQDFPLGPGWPGAEVVGALRSALDHDGDPGWFVLLDGVVVGECGTHGRPREGAVEIRYGIAPPYRGRGLATDACTALTTWLFELPGVYRVLARTHLDNLASRRALERSGFTLDRLDGPEAWYVRRR